LGLKVIRKGLKIGEPKDIENGLKTGEPKYSFFFKDFIEMA
jgi:hypothetical protein